MRSLLSVLVCALALTLAAPTIAAETGPWNLPELRKVPESKVIDPAAPVTEVYYAGESYKGQPTRVFAWLARPAKAEGKRPAMVLVHGGGGKAFREWAELWSARGYVALAMDLAGHSPDGKRLPDGGPDQSDETKFGVAEPGDRWTYHAVANVIRGVSLLSSLPDVDAQRIGITGISWGGYLTCIVSGLDDRLKVSVPVYGCGFLDENSVWLPRFDAMTPERRATWTKLWDPSRYVGQATMPVLFMNGTNDFAYPMDSYRKTYRLVKNRDICVTVNMPHGHVQGWAPKEIGLYVDQHLTGGVPLANVKGFRREAGEAMLDFESRSPVKSAALHFTTDTGPWQQRKWSTTAARLETNRASAALPEARPLVYFMTLVDERDAVVSSEHEVLE
jgi:dienelactone hydrolase